MKKLFLFQKFSFTLHPYLKYMAFYIKIFFKDICFIRYVGKKYTWN
jgi:hypothetical protein